MTLRRILREPLLHFAVLGFLIFQYYQFTQPAVENEIDDAMSIVVSTAQIQQLTAHYQRMNMRAPSEESLNALIENYIQEEVMYREALAMQLDKNDAQVRSRLKTKLDYLLEDISSTEVTDEVLLAFLDKNAETYRSDAFFSFQQIFISPDKHKDSKTVAEQVLVKALTNAQKGEDTSTLGDVTMMNKKFENISETKLNVTFGSEFTAQLIKAKSGEWAGPIVSEFGYHIVNISQHQLAKPATLEKVRFKLTRDFNVQRKKENKEKIYQVLRKKYQVSIAPKDDLLVAN